MPAQTAKVRSLRVALLEPPPLRLYPISAPDSSRSFNISFGASLLLHALLVFGIGFTVPKPAPLPNLATLEVVLVNSRSATAPVNAQVAAQANLDGGGNTERDVRARNPFPVIKQETPSTTVQVAPKRPREEALEEAARRKEEEAEVARRKVEELEKQQQQLLTQMQSDSKVAPRTEDKPQSEASPARQESGPSTGDLLARSFEMARLEATIDKSLSVYQKRPRMKFVGARTKEVRFASYIENWRQKVERVGTLNYPDEARQQKIYGSLVLTVAIRWDGTVEKVEINRSSGHNVLDAAARRIVELAAPYAPFPEDIRRDTDILNITRTWTFTTQDQLVAD